MSEEAQERSNKTIKVSRDQFARKNCRENTNRDIINRMLITSDPLVNAHLKPSRKHHIDLPEDVQSMLINSQEQENVKEDKSLETDDSDSAFENL